jgi:signal peptidase I
VNKDLFSTYKYKKGDEIIIMNIEAPNYCYENYKLKQGGNLWHDYNDSSYKVSNEEIDKKVEECIHELNQDARLNFINKSNGDTLIIVERSKFGHYSVYVAKGYQECTVIPSYL